MIDELLLANNMVRILEGFDLYTREDNPKYVTVKQVRDILVPRIIEKSKVKDSDDFMALICFDYINDYCDHKSCKNCVLLEKKEYCVKEERKDENRTGS